MLKQLLTATVLLLTFGAANAQQPASGCELIRQMYEKNHARFYTTLTFSQEVLNYRNDSLLSKDVWHEAYLSPSNLILKFTSWESGNGVIFANDSLYTFEKGALKSTRYRMHDLLVLGFDVNNITPEESITRTEKMGYNLNRIEPSTCMGRKAWMVGDTTSKCFWVDAETLLFLRMQERTGDNARSVEFSRYEYFDGRPVGTEVRFYRNSSRPYMVERYFNVKPNAPVSTTIFDPKKFAEVKW